MTELWRALGAALEPSTPESARLADLLGLGPPPEESIRTDLLDFQLFPYGSVYCGAEGMLGGEARDRISGFWRALGTEPGKEPDHLVTLLASYGELKSVELGTDGAAAEEPRHGRLLHARTTFLVEHLLSWLPSYTLRLRDLAPPFYRRWAELMLEALHVEVEDLDPGLEAFPLPVHLRQAPALGQPQEESFESLISALLTPVRCGLILTRVDLKRAADELGLGIRIGERRFVLKALFSQDSAAVAGWLAGEARRQANVLGELAWLGSIQRFWAGRAEDSAALLEALARTAAEAAGEP